MKAIHADRQDAKTICTLMHEAFAEYKNSTPPSSALYETPESIEAGFLEGQKALIGYENGKAVAMLRYKEYEDHVYFYRLSVPPENQGKGYAKKLISELETYARVIDKKAVSCKVRASVERNMSMYEALGYTTVTLEEKEVNGTVIKVATVTKDFKSIGCK